AVYFVIARWAQARPRPLFASSFQLPARRDVDAPLVVGSAIFGVGWGLAGYCPGPALASVASCALSTWTFLAAMVVGMVVQSLVERFRQRAAFAASGRLSRG